jgi:riboflavin kinase/FMN adenylyltransferase
MQHIHDLNELNLESSWLTVGSFDGVHLGHKEIILPLVEGANQAGVPSVVVTFFPHPQFILRGESRPYYLTLPEKRAQLLADLGVDIVFTYPFDQQISMLSAKEFIAGLYERFHFSDLLIGYDFALGKDREGNSEKLRRLGDEMGYTLQVIPPHKVGGEVVSSSLIRGLIREGEITSANSLLGQDFSISGQVIKGDNRGKSLGFATCNLEVHSEVVNIKPGVYVTWGLVEGEKWPAVTNIGFRPTFGLDLSAPRIEAHLLGFSGDLYGQDVELIFVERLRDEMKFSKVDDLITQIEEDVAKTKDVLDQNGSSLPSQSSLV